MRGRMFSLVYDNDENDVYGWGVQLEGLERTSAVVILPDDCGQVSFGLHDSAESALRCWSGLDLKWLS